MARVSSNADLQTFDDASLVVALVEERVRPRYNANGLLILNHTERVLLAVFDLENEVCNGGFGQWLFHVAGDLLVITPVCLQDIGASDVAAIVRRVLAEFGEEGPAADYWQREQQTIAMPETTERVFQESDREFAGLEQGMLDRLYAFARAHLSEVRLAGMLASPPTISDELDASEMEDGL
jgi:hypothetical protein